MRGDYGPPRLRLCGGARERLAALGASHALVSLTHERRHAAALVLLLRDPGVSRARLVARLAAVSLLGGIAAARLLRVRPDRRHRRASLQPRPQRGVARASLARAAAPRGRDGGALREAAPARHRLRLPAPDPVRRLGPAAAARPRAAARLPRQRAARGAGAEAAAVDRRPAQGLQAPATGHDRARRPHAAPAHRGRGARPGRRGLRRRAPERRARGRRQRRVPGPAARAAHGRRRRPRAVGRRDPARAAGPAARSQLRLEPRLLRARRRRRRPDRDHGVRHRAADALALPALRALGRPLGRGCPRRFGRRTRAC